MTSRSRLILLFVLLVIVAACFTSTLLEIAAPGGNSVSFGILLITVLSLLGLLAILEVTGLLDDLIRGIAGKARGTRDTGMPATLGIGLLVGVPLGILFFQIAAMLSSMFD